MSDEYPSDEGDIDTEMPADAHEASGAGQLLRDERERQKLTLAQVASETRIPERHLLAIESGDFDGLPARTYAIGFSRSYARMLGLDERVVAQQVRDEMGQAAPVDRSRAAQFEPGDPARVPSRGLAWFGVFAAVLLIAGGFAFYRSYFAPGSGPAAATAPIPDDTAVAIDDDTADAGPQDDGQVVFTALEEGVWVRFYDASDNVLSEGQMAKGATFAVPKDADNPQIRTGRPDAFGVTIDGRSVAKLSEDDFVMKDVAVDAASLLARGQSETPAAPAT